MNDLEEKSPKEKKAISQYMSEIGRRGGLKNKRKGSAYFKWVRAQRKDAKKPEEK